MKVTSSCPPLCARPARPLRFFVRCRGTAHHLRQVRHISWLLSRERSGFPSENDQLTSRKAPTNFGVSPPLSARRARRAHVEREGTSSARGRRPRRGRSPAAARDRSAARRGRRERVEHVERVERVGRVGRVGRESVERVERVKRVEREGIRTPPPVSACDAFLRWKERRRQRLIAFC